MLCSLTPCFLATSATEPRSASRRMVTIWDSVKRLFLMTSSLEGSHLLKFQLVRKSPGRSDPLHILRFGSDAVMLHPDPITHHVEQFWGVGNRCVCSFHDRPISRTRIN